ncbi:complex I NDUFA9 subunit family protein [Sphingomonas aracearum]|uniref:Complex I NDUFA9 subunit family protein n=1 Tax=Sphingomonas aracearum TaxID=2283317 RepID=A0A369VUD2_9SPHN|nr:complex I NDUFA9 subunit family protein [Sphingomonas aracearum]RDE05958.1 complex I NDUFA9 subunit family protein [Sphingomonas aracearum]
MKDKLVTLIGGGGFVGRYAAQALLRAGARVRIAQRDPRQAFFLKTQSALGQSQFVAVDVRKPASIARAVAGSDAVVYLVGALSGDFQALQADGPRHAAEAAARAGAGSFVLISAIGADATSAAAYARTKAAGEAGVHQAFPGATILRPSIVFGREDQFINRFAGMLSRAPIVPVLKPEAKFQPVFVKDVAQAIVAALSDPKAHGGRTYELGGPDVLSMAALMRWIGEAIGRTPSLVELPDPVSAAIAALGFLPGAPITSDQWKMLQTDNVVAPGADGLEALGVEPTPLASVAPNWLVRFRREGRFSAHASA